MITDVFPCKNVYSCLYNIRHSYICKFFMYSYSILVSFVSWHINLHEVFNVKAILLEEQQL